jgi:glycerol-3-phosphate acyltransferase PlsX
MTESRPITVAVDAVGGDFAPDEILAGVALAVAADPALRIVLTGPAEVVEAFASSAGGRITAVPTTEVIGMDEHPANAVRTKKDSSMVVGCRLVKEGSADAFFSAGSTGAAMAAATLVIGRLKGVLRPAIATVLPTGGPPTVLLDVGANADCKPEHLRQFAIMGSAYASTVLGVAQPRIGLLSIGEEPTKGSQLVVEAHELMKDVPGFIGNVEGRDVLSAKADVIVTDGFTGNVVLKLLEGASSAFFGQVKSAVTASPAAKLAGAVLKPELTRLKDRLDPDNYGGAPLLGIDGVCVIAHGSSKSKAVFNGIRVAAQAGRGGLTEHISGSLDSR